MKGRGAGVRPRQGRGCSPPGGPENQEGAGILQEDGGGGLSDFSTLQDALAKLNPGSTVTLS